MKFKRRKTAEIAALMLSRNCRVGDILSTHDGHRMVVTQRLTPNVVRCRALTWREKFGPAARAIATALLCAAGLLFLAWCVVQHMEGR